MRTWQMSIGTVVALLLVAGTGAPSVAQEMAEAESAAISGRASFVKSTPAAVLEETTTVPQFHAEGYQAVPTVRTSDPRLNGRLEATSNYVQLTPGPEGGYLRSGRGRLSNDGGSWLGEFHGFARPGMSVYAGSHYWIHLTGEGGCADLSATLVFLPTGSGQWDLKGVCSPERCPSSRR